MNEATASARSHRYTHGHHETVLRSHRWRTVENSAAYLLPYLRPGMSLLDVGCGPGTITRDLAVRLAPGQVVGIDPAEDVVAMACAECPGPSRLEVADVAGYAERHPAERFDVVHAHQVLQHVADPVGTLRVMGRLVAPGGLVAARDGDFAAMAWFPRLPELQEWLRLYQAAARANGGEPDAGRRLFGWARAAGFTDVTATASTWCFATPQERAWWGGMWADRIVESSLARQIVDSSLATDGDLRAISDGWRRWADDPDGWFAVLHGEIICRS